MVEDNNLNKQVTAAMLRRLGHDHDHAANGQEALDRLAERAYDLVLMDCHMPVMDGYEASRQIRRLAGPASRVRIFALTAGATDAERQRCLDAGMDEVLSKPILFEVLARRLTALG
ncbi:MAG: response regulator [Nannocystaceae bacterium]